MMFGKAFITTALLACHLILASPVVTSQLLSVSGMPAPARQSKNPPAPGSNDGSSRRFNGKEVTMLALTQEKNGTTYFLRGNAEIDYLNWTLHADEVTYNSDTGGATAEGHVILDGGPNVEHIEATRAAYNLWAETGRFENVNGAIGIRMRASRPVLSSPNPFLFTGKVVLKTAPDHYTVQEGTVTTCKLPRPKWAFDARKVVVNVNGNAKIYNSTFLFEGIPILYFPFATHPVQRSPRQSGFLLPNIGRSSTKGIIFGESAFWAINRSMDARIGAQYFSTRGWAQEGEFRARPSPRSFIHFSYYGVLDRGYGPQKINQGGEDVRLDAESPFPHNFRGVADIDYLSAFVFRLAFADVFTQAVNSEVKSQAFLSNNTNGYFYNFSARRYQDFQSTTAGDVVTILHAPSVELASADHQIESSPFYWSYDFAADGLSRSQPLFHTAPLLGRFDLDPTVSAPLWLDGWSLRPQLSIRSTLYTQQREPTGEIGIAKSSVINRKTLEGSVEVRPPAIDRIFDKEFLGRRWKHVVEPRVVYDYVTGVRNFANILRFDERDILTDTNEIEYGVVNRLYAKRTLPGASTDCGPATLPVLADQQEDKSDRAPWEHPGLVPARPSPKGTEEDVCIKQPEAREIVTWEVAQKYFLNPTFGGALVPGRSNVFNTTVDLTGIAFLTESRRLSPLISRLRIQPNVRSDVEWDLDYDIKSGRINSSTAMVSYLVGQFTFGTGDSLLQGPLQSIVPGSVAGPVKFNQFRLQGQYGRPNTQGATIAASVGFDAILGSLQYSAVQAAYNWDCCGFNVEYRRFSLGPVRDENQWRFTFVLANIGSFGNLRRQERIF